MQLKKDDSDNSSRESVNLSATALPQDLLLLLFALARSQSAAASRAVRLVNKEWRGLFDSSLPCVRLRLASSHTADFLARLRALTQLDLSSRLLLAGAAPPPPPGADNSCLEALLSVASRLPKLQSLTLGGQALLGPEPPEATSATSAIAASAVDRQLHTASPSSTSTSASTSAAGAAAAAGDDTTTTGSGDSAEGAGADSTARPSASTAATATAATKPTSAAASAAAAAPAAAVPAAAAAAAGGMGPLTVAVTAPPCARSPNLPAAAVAALRGLRRLSIGGPSSGAPEPGDPPHELSYGTLPQELPLELLELRCLEQLDLYGIPLAPARGQAQELSRLSQLTSLHLACSPPSLLRSVAHLSHLTALRRLALHCTTAPPLEPPPPLEPMGLELGGEEHLPAGVVAVVVGEAVVVEAEEEEQHQPQPGGGGGGGGGSEASRGRSIVAMLSTNCQLFRGLQQLAEAGVALSELSYRGTFLTLPPPYLRLWTSLERLDLSHNSLMRDEGLLESQIACLTRLTHLDLSYNRLDELPCKLCTALSELRCLDVSHNQLTALPPLTALSALSYLTRLAAASNRLTTLPDALATALPALQHLDVAANPRLESLPEGLTTLGRLEVLC